MQNDADNDLGPIYSYADREAIRDGLLVPVAGPCGVNRATRAVFEAFTSPFPHPSLDIVDVTLLVDVIDAMVAIEPEDGWRIGTYGGKTLWLIPNETGGLTLMFPEDY